ncbi:MAG: M16 family metallopeptidase [Planctomycetota bacterium]
MLGLKKTQSSANGGPIRAFHRGLFGLAIMLGILLSGTGYSGRVLTADEGTKKVNTVEGITEYRLGNGLIVLLFPDESRPTVTVNLTVFVGSRHEGYGETGMAHLLEHLVFKGSPRHANIPKALSDRGARFNGTTSDDRTNYFETLPASDENLEFALDLESDRFVNSFIKREDLLSEMTVVRNEFERGENSPSRVLFQRISAAAYEWHNYGKSTIGNRSDIERVPIENLQAFYRKFYQPDNAMLVVAGKFQEAKALNLVEKYFGAIPRPKRELPNTYTEEPAQDGERNVTLRRVGDVALIGTAYHVCAGAHEDFAPVAVLTRILGNQPSGRLYKALVDGRKASSIFAFTQPKHDPGLILLGAEVPKEQSTDDALAALNTVTESVGTEGVTEEELQRAKQQLLKEWELSSADTTQIAIQLSNWAGQGDWRLYFLYRDRVEKVTAEEVKAVAARYLQRNNRTVGIFQPSQESQRVEVPATPDIEKLVGNYKGRQAVSAGEAFDVSPENIEARTTRSVGSSGLKMAMLPKKNRGETVSLTLRLRYGNAESLRGRALAASVLPDLMERGTKSMNFAQLRDALDKEKIRLGAGGEPGVLTLSVQTKRDNLPAALEILNKILREPALDEQEFETLRREQVTEIEQNLSDPQMLAYNKARRESAPYSAEDPRYTPTIAESVEQMKKLSVSEVKAVYDELLSAQTGELVVVGDFDPAAVAKFEKSLADWKSPAKFERLTRGVPEKMPAGKQVIDTPDKENAVYVSIGVSAMKNDDPDYPAMVVSNYIFGASSLASRLADRVRQKEGLSYGIGSSFNAASLDSRAVFQIVAITNPKNMARLETVVKEELAKWLKDGVKPEELEQAKQAYLKQLEVGRSSDDRLTGMLADNLFENRTMAFQVDFEKKVKALTVEQVNAAIRRHLNSEKLLTITAGDFNKK